MIHEVSEKQSIKCHQMWQMKGTGHKIYSLNDMKLLMDEWPDKLYLSLETTARRIMLPRR